MPISPAAEWINVFFASFDVSVTTAVHSMYDLAGNFFTGFFEFISLLGKGGVVLILLSIALMFYKKTRLIGTAMLISVAIGALFTNCCLKIVFSRPRPYLDNNSVFYQFWLVVGQNVESDKSFPSGHTTAAFATMTALFFTGNKKYSWTGFIFAFLMGIARIYLCVHYPSDVLGGIVVGVVSAVIGTIIAKKLPEKYYESVWIRSAYVGKH